MQVQDKPKRIFKQAILIVVAVLAFIIAAFAWISLKKYPVIKTELIVAIFVNLATLVSAIVIMNRLIPVNIRLILSLTLIVINLIVSFTIHKKLEQLPDPHQEATIIRSLMVGNSGLLIVYSGLLLTKSYKL